MSPPPFPTKRMLGIDFFVGTAARPRDYLSHYWKARLLPLLITSTVAGFRNCERADKAPII